MKPQPHTLVEIRKTVLESTERRRAGSLGDFHLTKEDAGKRRVLDEMAVSGYLVIPPLTAEGEPFDFLTVGRKGEPSKLSGVYLHAVYEPARSRVHVTMNAGGATPELVGATIEGATPELVCGRVLELFVEISQGRIFASLHDRFAGGDLLLGDVALSTGGRKEPWGVSPAGTWRVTFGMGAGQDETTSSPPPGFALADLRITLGSENDETLGSLPYSGALNHLVSDRWEAPSPPPEEEQDPGFDLDLDFSDDDKPISQILIDFARVLDDMSGGASGWARRAESLAAEARQLAIRLPEDLGLENN